MSNVVSLPFPVTELTKAITDLAFNAIGPYYADEPPIDEVIAWAMAYVEPSPVLYDQDSSRHAGTFDPEIERLLSEEEAIERSVRERADTPDWRP